MQDGQFGLAGDSPTSPNSAAASGLGRRMMGFMLGSRKSKCSNSEQQQLSEKQSSQIDLSNSGGDASRSFSAITNPLAALCGPNPNSLSSCSLSSQDTVTTGGSAGLAAVAAGPVAAGPVAAGGSAMHPHAAHRHHHVGCQGTNTPPSTPALDGSEAAAAAKDIGLVALQDVSIPLGVLQQRAAYNQVDDDSMASTAPVSGITGLESIKRSSKDSWQLPTKQIGTKQSIEGNDQSSIVLDVSRLQEKSMQKTGTVASKAAKASILSQSPAGSCKDVAVPVALHQAVTQFMGLAAHQQQLQLQQLPQQHVIQVNYAMQDPSWCPVGQNLITPGLTPNFTPALTPAITKDAAIDAGVEMSGAFGKNTVFNARAPSPASTAAANELLIRELQQLLPTATGAANVTAAAVIQPAGSTAVLHTEDGVGADHGSRTDSISSIRVGRRKGLRPLFALQRFSSAARSKLRNWRLKSSAAGRRGSSRSNDHLWGFTGVSSRSREALIRPRIEPKTFFANERTFLSWLQISVLVMMTGLGLLSGSTLLVAGNGSAGSTVGCMQNTLCGGARISGAIIAPVSVLFMLYALYLFKKRTHHIINRSTVRYDDQKGPVLLTLLLLAVTVVSLVLAIQGFHDDKHG
eukprot:GHRR01000663.1.p1 GENE.GHRR01000663.1~~GHRR01000663.1.p1  ORF type:complete len:641 (+),score=240.85 GHRR01000663.1:33-1925(+)